MNLTEGVRPESEEHKHAAHPWVAGLVKAGAQLGARERNRLFLGVGDGTFLDYSDLSGADSPMDARSAVASDFDDDGDVDLFIHNVAESRHQLLRNELDGAGGRFLKIRLRATSSQYEAIGATVTVETQTSRLAQVLSRGAGFASCHPPELVFGLGANSRARVEVHWPGGERESFGEVQANSRLLLVEGRGEPEMRAGRPYSLLPPLPRGLKRGPGATVPNLVVVDSEGRERVIDLEERSEAERVYLAFWASYCRPCIREIPDLEALHRRPGQSVVAISLDVPQHRGRATRALETGTASYPNYFVALDDAVNEAALDELVDLLRLPIPTTLVVGKGATIEAVLRGVTGD